MILPVLLSVKLHISLQGKGRRLRAYENEVLKKTFGARKEKVIASWRKLCNEEIINVYVSLILLGF
jgi:hypothetical protein